MRKSVVGLAVFLLAVTPALAAKKMARHAKARPAPTQPANPNEAGMRLMRESIPLFLPTVLMPFYFKMKSDKENKAGKHMRKKKM